MWWMLPHVIKLAVNSRAVKTTARLLYHSLDTQHRLRFVPDLHPAGSPEILLTCSSLEKQKMIPQEAHCPKSWRFPFRPATAQLLAFSCCRLLFPAHLLASPSLATTETTWLSRSDSSSCRPLSLPPYISPAGKEVSNCIGDDRGTQLQLWRFYCLEQSCIEWWNHLVLTARVG